MKRHGIFLILCSLAFAATLFIRSANGAQTDQAALQTRVSAAAERLREIASKSSSGGATALIIGAEQRERRAVLLEPNADWSRSESILWEWEPSESPEVLPNHVSWFNNISEVKPVHGTDALLCAASGGGAALVRLADKKVLFYAFAGGNTHSAALLPDGNIVSASSTGGYLRLFVAPEAFTSAEAIESTDYPLPDAHGVVWDSKRQTLWALGGEELVGYSYAGPKESPSLTVAFRTPLSEKLAGGHDLYPMPGFDALFVTGLQGVGLFDPATRTLTEVLDAEHVKSISLDETGRLLVQIPEEQWWSATLRFLDPDRSAVGTLPGARFYKARWWLPDTFSAGLPPACALWPDSLLAEPVAWHEAGESNGRVTPIFYDGAMYQGKPTKVFAYLGRPEGEGPFPAVLLIHGGGGKAFPDWAEYWANRGYVALAMDLGGCGADGQRHDAAGSDQSDESKFRDFFSNDYTDVWTWQAIAAILKGHALLKSLPCVDSKKIAATGISWGGYLTSILSGVDRQIACFVPVYGCGFLHENSAWVRVPGYFDQMSPEKKSRFVALFDPSSHLPRSTAPMLWVNGTNDLAYPLDSYQKSYRLPAGARTLAIAINRPHGHIWTFPEVDAFIDHALEIGDAKPLIAITTAALEGDTLSVKVVGDEKPVSAELLWTVDSGAWEEKKWESAPAVMNGDTVSATVPADAKAAFLNLTDSRGLVVSSEHIER